LSRYHIKACNLQKSATLIEYSAAYDVKRHLSHKFRLTSLVINLPNPSLRKFHFGNFIIYDFLSEE